MSHNPSAKPDPPKLPVAWAIVPVISLGILSWAPFLYASVRTHARKYRILTGLYLGWRSSRGFWSRSVAGMAAQLAE